MRLTVELGKRDLKVTPEMLTQDGKFILLNIGPAWPTIRIGASGGVELPAIRSYPRAFEAAVDGDKLLAKQAAKDAKKFAAAATPAAVKPEQKKEVQAETTTQKKQKHDQKIEQELQHA